MSVSVYFFIIIIEDFIVCPCRKSQKIVFPESSMHSTLKAKLAPDTTVDDSHAT